MGGLWGEGVMGGCMLPLAREVEADTLNEERGRGFGFEGGGF